MLYTASLGVCENKFDVLSSISASCLLCMGVTVLKLRLDTVMYSVDIQANIYVDFTASTPMWTTLIIRPHIPNSVLIQPVS